MKVKPGHGDHWLAALDQADPRLANVLAFPADAPDALALHRTPLTPALNTVHLTHHRKLVSAYPEPRATTTLSLRPRELLLWETGVEGWLVADHASVGVLTLFLTDLAGEASRYQSARGSIELAVGGLAYHANPAAPDAGPNRLAPARTFDERFLPDDYAFTGEVHRARKTPSVHDVEFQGGLQLPVVMRGARFAPEDVVQGFVWLTARWPEEQGS